MTPSLRALRALESISVLSLGCFRRCKARRKAVRFPIPGSIAISCTAFSSNFEEKSMYKFTKN
jgi:hypothetical protein